MRQAPAELGPVGARFYREVTRNYQLRADELRVLPDAAAECDLIDELAKAAKGAPQLVTGSQGQPVINPLISELRMHRATLASLLKQLALPDEGSNAAPGSGFRSVKARKGAQARWGKWDS
jgi:hypothetical protein